MSQVAILYKNILEYATSITPTDVNTLFPAYRLYDRDIGKLFKGNTAANPFNIVINQAATPLPADHLVIPVGHNLNGLTVKLQYSATGAWAGEEVDALSWTPTAALIDKTFTTQTKEYWRLKIAAPGAAPEFSEMFLGSLYTFETNPLYSGFNESTRRNIIRDETQSGRTRRVKFGDPREYRKYSLMAGATQKASLELWESTWEGTKAFYVWDTSGECYFMELMNELSFIPLSATLWTCELELLQVL